MKFKKFNNLLELFMFQYQKKDANEIFLQSLKKNDLKFNWKQTHDCVQKLSDTIGKYIFPKDRCLLISENRPEWLISDLAIMLASCITVPAYTTYTERDYEYIIDDCTPTIIIISNITQYEKIKNIIPKKKFIKRIIFFENIENINEEKKKLTVMVKIFGRKTPLELNYMQVEKDG